MEPFNSRRAPAYATKGMVASSQPLAAQVGLQVLKDGGNAADAAIAVAAMVNVTEPMMNGLGGDAFMLIYWQGKLYGLNASGKCPQSMSRERFVHAGWTRMPQAGWGSVSVPGAPDGYFALHERFGSKNFANLVEPAAFHAEEGFAVGRKVAHVWKWGASKLRPFPLRRLYCQRATHSPGDGFSRVSRRRTPEASLKVLPVQIVLRAFLISPFKTSLR
jgi:gamma-glutamyltranspeptidase/glutathione hydrolase